MKPKPPPSLDLAVMPDHDLESEGVYRRLGFFDTDLSGRVAESVDFSQCRFKGADLSGVNLGRAEVTDCLFEKSNLANLRAGRSSLIRTRLSILRMTGFTWLDGVVRDVTFEECRLDLSGWRFTDFRSVIFTKCNLSKADFTGADLTGAQFIGCDLTRAQFSNAKMSGTRFDDCTLLDVGGVTSWEGAVLRNQDLVALSYTLAAALGIRIDDDSE
ncbi:pentapeptide repeat-containing protein [Micromonospora sp. NPDC049679]|uniref:pentapeptide repeat-containing protein n=1 Tax=Micromonospora sp. NPDC049679 TaxID=3155920 RepID=UPI0033CA9002